MICVHSLKFPQASVARYVLVIVYPGDRIPVCAGLSTDLVTHMSYRNSSAAIITGDYGCCIGRRYLAGAAYRYRGGAGNRRSGLIVHCNHLRAFRSVAAVISSTVGAGNGKAICTGLVCDHITYM
jgi:hypothetical protein